MTVWDEWQVRDEPTVAAPAGSVGAALPAVVLVPAHPSLTSRDGRTVSVELTRLPTGGVGLVAFSSAEALVASLGSVQPWVAVAAEQLGSIARGATVLLDPPPLPGGPLWSSDALLALAAVPR